MEENSGGTPNPLNPNPAVGQTPETTGGQTEENNSPTSVVDSFLQKNNTPAPRRPIRPSGGMISDIRPPRNRMANPSVSEFESIEEPYGVPQPEPGSSFHSINVETFEPIQASAPINNAPIQNNTPMQNNMNPTVRPMEQMSNNSAPKKPRRKKTGLIIGLIVSLFIAVFCGILAVLLFINGGDKGDPVATAMNRLISGKAPENVAVDGTISFNIKNPSSPVSSLQVVVKGEAVTKSMINTATATLNVGLQNGGSFSINFNEVYAVNGDLYLKVDGITNVLGNPSLVNNRQEVDCYIEEGCPSGNDGTDTSDMNSILAVMKSLQSLDGKWVRFSTDEANSLGNMFKGDDSQDLGCLVGLFTNSDNGRTLANFYNKNPFIGSTTENLRVNSEKDPIYLVQLQEENFKIFMDQVQDSAMLRDYTACVGHERAWIDADGLVKSLRELPEVYVEVDSDNDFTRLYFETDFSENDFDAVVDLRFAYPYNVNVSAPSEYSDFSTLITGLEAAANNSQTNTPNPEVKE